MTYDSPFIFDTEDNFDDSYAQMQENDSIYEGNKEFFILEVNDSNLFKDFYFNIEDKYLKEIEEKNKEVNNEVNDEKNIEEIIMENNENKLKETKTKANLTSRTNVNNKKIENDNNIVIHNIKRRNTQKRKTAKFIAIQPNEDSKVVNVIRRGSKCGRLALNLLNLNKIKEE